MKIRKLLALLAALALLFAACGSDTSDTDDAAEAASDADVEASMAEDEAMEDEAMQDEAMEDDESSASASEEAMEDETMEDDEPSASASEEAMEDEEEPMEDNAMEDGEGEATADAEAAGEVPTRIVSLSPTGTEMLFAVGAGDQVIAVDNFSYYPPEAPVVEDLSAFTPSVEAIAAFEPDLILTSSPVEGLDALGVEILQLNAAVDLDEVYAQIEQVGAVTGHIGEATEVVLNMQTDIAAVLDSLPEREVPLTYYHELDPTLFSVTSSTFVGYVYGLLGLENVADAADEDGSAFGYPQLNQEYLLTADPDIIFLADTLCCEQNATTLGEREGWELLTAVQTGNIVEMNDDIVSRWGPRLVEFIQVAGEAVSAIEAVPAG